jgi:hypothetical protein
LTSTDYSTFKIKFQVDVTFPTNLIGQTTSITAYIQDSANFQTFGKSGAVTAMSVTKPSGQADTQATGLVSFGKNPNDATEITRGVGVYSTPYCIIAGAPNSGYGADYVSNCGLGTDVDAHPTSTGTKVLSLVNAIEVNWALPYDIPNDRTVADIVCKTEQKSGSNNDATKYSYDPLRVHQSSMMAKGWGTGNCFYLGAVAATPGAHRF